MDWPAVLQAAPLIWWKSLIACVCGLNFWQVCALRVAIAEVECVGVGVGVVALVSVLRCAGDVAVAVAVAVKPCLLQERRCF